MITSQYQPNLSDALYHKAIQLLTNQGGRRQGGRAPTGPDGTERDPGKMPGHGPSPISRPRGLDAATKPLIYQRVKIFYTNSIPLAKQRFQFPPFSTPPQTPAENPARPRTNPGPKNLPSRDRVGYTHNVSKKTPFGPISSSGAPWPRRPRSSWDIPSRPFGRSAGRCSCRLWPGRTGPASKAPSRRRRSWGSR